MTWRGIYFDGLRAGFWTNYVERAVPWLKDAHFTWLPAQKIWVGPARYADQLFARLDSKELPAEEGRVLWDRARRHPEPFFAMATVPTMTEGNGFWRLKSVYERATLTRLQAANGARWNADAKTWDLHGDLPRIAEFLEGGLRFPLRFVRIVRADGSVQGPTAPCWRPYKMRAAADMETAERDRSRLGVDGCPLEEYERPEDAPPAKPQEEKPLVEPALSRPLELLPVDEEALQGITEFASLMPHQIDGVRHFLARSSALNADDMGLGKTRQTIAAAGHLPGGKVIVCPASLKDNWSREIRMVYPEANPFVFEDRIPDEQPEWLIVNYERIGPLLPMLEASDWRFVVFAADEAHYLKEPTAQRTENAFALAERAERKWLLTATPLLNDEKESWTLLRLSGHPAGDLQVREFSKAFARSEANRVALGERIAEWMLRRTKDEAITLPGKYRQEPLISPESEAMAAYDATMGDETMLALQKINFARQWLERVKRGPILEMLEELQPEAKALVFCNYTSTVDWFMDKLGDTAVRLTGKENRKQRNEAVQRFQTDPDCRWFIGNIKAAGVGINLTAATYVFFVSRPWTPADQFQAEDRAYRIGQNKRVEVYVPTVPRTIDEDIRKLLESKQVITDDVLAAAVESRRQTEEARTEDEAD